MTENKDMERVLEENEWLKKSIKRQQSSNKECSKYIEELVKENEQLKSTNMEMEDYLGRLEERIKELKKENQELLLIIENQKLRDELKK